jgi:hypothetical protein
VADRLFSLIVLTDVKTIQVNTLCWWSARVAPLIHFLLCLKSESSDENSFRILRFAPQTLMSDIAPVSMATPSLAEETKIAS